MSVWKQIHFTLIACFLLLIAALLWRAFVYEKPRVASAKPQPVAATPVIAPSAQALSESALILDLFNPSESAANAQRSHSQRKRQIEEAITLSFVLKRCALISGDDYYDTYRALIAYAQHTGLAADYTAASGEVQAIAQSASASYALIYSRTACNTPQLRNTATQLKSWRDSVLNPVPRSG